MRLSRNPDSLYAQLNETYFEGVLPSNPVIRFVDFPGTGEAIDTRCHSGACWQSEGKWIIELHSGLKTLGVDCVALILAHEMVHMKWPVKAHRHNAKVWGEEYRRLVGLRFFEEIF